MERKAKNECERKRMRKDGKTENSFHTHRQKIAN